jgi:hypothetical protein
MNAYEEIKQEFAGVVGAINMYFDGGKYYFVDVDDNRLEGYRYVTASCGCCSETENFDYDLDYELEYMAEEDVADLMEQLSKLK